MLRIIAAAGRALGMATSGLTALLWIYVIWFPGAVLQITGASVLVAGFMVVLALAAGIASFRGHWPVVIFACAVSFLPIGAMLLGVNHWLRYVGVLNVLLAVAGGMIWLGNRNSQARP